VGNNRDFDYGLVGNLRTIVNAMCELHRATPLASTIRSSRCCARTKPRARARTTRSLPLMRSQSIPCACAMRSTSFYKRTRSTSETRRCGHVLRFRGSSAQTGGWMDPGPLARSASAPARHGIQVRSAERDVVVLYGDCSFTLTAFRFHHHGAPQAAVCGVSATTPRGTKFGLGRSASTPVAATSATWLARALRPPCAGHGRLRHPGDQTRGHPPGFGKGSRFGLPALVDVVIDRDVYSSAPPTRRCTSNPMWGQSWLATLFACLWRKRLPTVDCPQLPKEKHK